MSRNSAKQEGEIIVRLVPLSEHGEWWTPDQMKEKVQPCPENDSWAWKQGYRPGDYISPDGYRIWKLEGWLQKQIICTTTAEGHRLPNGTYPRFNKAVIDREDVIQPAPLEVWLYRMYGANNELLYIGISKSAFARFEQHSHTQPWINQVASWKRTPYPNREEALEAEREAIIREHPRYNIIHNKGAAA